LLRLAGRLRRVEHTGEDDEEAVALRVDLATVVVGEGGAHKPMVVGKHS